jgi:ankyrin repeat protein
MELFPILDYSQKRSPRGTPTLEPTPPSKIPKQNLLIATKQKDVEIVIKNLQSATCDPNETDQLGNTPLHCAIFSGHTKIIDLLLQHPKTDPTLINSSGKTALDLVDPLIPENQFFELHQKIFARQQLNNSARTYADKLISEHHEIALQLKNSDHPDHKTATITVENYAKLALETTNEELKKTLQPEMNVTLDCVQQWLIFYINQPKSSR